MPDRKSGNPDAESDDEEFKVIIIGLGHVGYITFLPDIELLLHMIDLESLFYFSKFSFVCSSLRYLLYVQEEVLTFYSRLR